uniref:Copper transport protein n=1 Tax=Culicoides sonorensis TaxID=179676 RepID=A0A336M467_CULSO
MGIETHSHGRENGGCDMIMLFHGGVCETIFFNSWTTHTLGPFIGTAIAIFFLTILHEGLKFLRERYYDEERRMERSLPRDDRRKTFSSFLCNKYHLVQTLMHFIQVTLAYALMLIYMNFNYYQCLAILLGFAVGYFIFGWAQKSTTDTNDCCY